MIKKKKEKEINEIDLYIGGKFLVKNTSAPLYTITTESKKESNIIWKNGINFSTTYPNIQVIKNIRSGLWIIQDD